MSGAIKNRDEEKAKYQTFLKEGQRKLKEYGANLLLNKSESSKGITAPEESGHNHD